MPNSQFSTDFGFRRGSEEKLSRTKVLNGTINVCIDTGNVYFDIDDQRIPTRDITIKDTETQVRSIPNPGPRMYFAKDTCNLMFFDINSLKWKICSAEHVGMSEYANRDGDGNVFGEYYESIENSDLKIQYVNNDIENLRTLIGQISSFEIVVLDDADDLPAEGQSHTIYFVPQDDSDEDTQFDEFIWLDEDGCYEKIGITRPDLADYYKKTEVDNLLSDLESGLESDIGTVQSNLDNVDADLQSTKNLVSGNISDIADLQAAVTNNNSDSINRDSAIEDSISALSGKVDDVIGDESISLDDINLKTLSDMDADIIGDPTLNLDNDNLAAHKSTLEDHTSRIEYLEEHDGEGIVGRLEAIEDDIGDDSTANSVKGRIKALEDDTSVDTLEGRVDTTETNIGNLETAIGDDSTAASVKGRIKAAEDSISSLEDAVGSGGSSSNSLTSRVSAAEDDIDALETSVGDIETAIGNDLTAASINGRIKIAEDDIDALEVAIGDDTVATSVKGRIKTVEDSMSGLSTDLGSDTTSGSVKYRIKTNEDAISSINTAIGADNSANTIKGRIKANETAISGINTAIGADNSAGTVKGRIKAAEDNISSIGTDIGSDSTANSIKGRIKAVEDSVTGINTDIGSDSTDGSIKGRIKTLEDNASGYQSDIGDLQTAIGDDDTAASVKGRIKTLEDSMTTAQGTIENIIGDDELDLDTINLKSLKETIDLISDTSGESITSLVGRVGANELNITSLQGNITDINADISDLKDYKTSNTNRVTEINTTLQSNITTVNNNLTSHVTACENADSDLQDQIDEVADQLNNIGRFSCEIFSDVSDLPPEGENGVLYFVPTTDPNIYNQYIWVSTESTYHLVGLTTLNLTDYYTKTEIDNKLSNLNTGMGYDQGWINVTGGNVVIEFGDEEDD